MSAVHYRGRCAHVIVNLIEIGAAPKYLLHLAAGIFSAPKMLASRIESLLDLHRSHTTRVERHKIVVSRSILIIALAMSLQLCPRPATSAEVDSIKPSEVPAIAAQALTVPDRETEQRVLETVHELYGGTSEVRAYLPLTEAFRAASRWELVATKETALQSNDEITDPNPVTICFVRSDVADCAEKRLFPISDRDADNQERLFYTLLEARVVYASADRTAPLLLLKACSSAGINGNCRIYTFLFAYDHSRDQFDLVFHDFVPRNNNGITRFVETGPLLGDVISAAPTSNAPYGYFVSVYRSDASGHYAQILRYRSKTHYADGNPLSVVDSDMPEILLQLGLWKPGDPLPVPFAKPDGCTKLTLIKGEEWCQGLPLHWVQK